MSLATRLQEILNAARIDDDEIRSGIRLSDDGIAKVAKRLGVSTDEVRSTMHELVDRLRKEHAHDMTDDSIYGVVYEEAASEPRYAYECDFLGNLTVRDANTGDEHYVSGSDSAHILRELEATKSGSPEEQETLRQVCEEHPRRSLVEDDEEGAGNDLLAEIKNDAGSYNFPWRVGNKHGTGTAAYVASSKEFKLKLVSIRDDRGEEISADNQLTNEITRQARDFIGQE